MTESLEAAATRDSIEDAGEHLFPREVRRGADLGRPGRGCDGRTEVPRYEYERDTAGLTSRATSTTATRQDERPALRERPRYGRTNVPRYEYDCDTAKDAIGTEGRL